jgi:glycosyltransferase involved in cell wall biosynthesis
MGKIIIIDPNFTEASPSMKGIVKSVPDLLEAVRHLEVWCWNHANVPGVHFRILPRIPAPHILMGWAFFFAAHLYWIGWKLRGRKHSDDILVTTGFYLLPADVALIHFSTFDWMKAQLRIGFHTIRDFLELAYSVLLRVPSEFLLLWNPWPTRLVSVSRSVGGDMKRWGAPWKEHALLPNPYDPGRFNEQVRLQERDGVRKELAVSDDDKVFLFASAGHYQRKGFWLAVEAVALVRKSHPNVRLLVIGGSAAALERLKTKAAEHYAGWSNWLQFTGMTTEMPRYLAAGDALLFPSYSEAFSLVEIEAAAMGLRLYLTPHHGSEMILREGENGREIPWNPEGIARILQEEIETGVMRPGISTHGEAPTQSDYATRLLQAIGFDP